MAQLEGRVFVCRRGSWWFDSTRHGHEEVIMDWHEIAKTISEDVQAKGFEAVTEENVLGKLMLVVTELNEAREFVHGMEDDPIEEEIADVVIRILQALHDLYGINWTVHRFAVHCKHSFAPIEVMLWPILDNVCHAAEDWRKDDHLDVKYHLINAIAECFRFSERLGFDLEDAIQQKMEKNRGRPPLHGKKRSL